MPTPSRSTNNPRGLVYGRRIPALKRQCPSSELDEESEARTTQVDSKTNDSIRRINYDAPLIPSNCVSALEGTQSFSTVFEERYCANGGHCPPFFIGSLHEAMKEAFDKPTIAERRPFILYIHQDGDTFMEDFRKELCFDETAAMLRSNFVIWPWDVTAKENQAKLMTWFIEKSMYNVMSDVVYALSKSNFEHNHCHSSNGISMMLILIKNGKQLSVVKLDDQNETYQADTIFDTLTKVLKQSADVKNREISRKRAHQADQ